MALSPTPRSPEMIVAKPPPPPPDLQAQLLDNIKFAVCLQRHQQDANQYCQRQRRLQKRKRCLQEESSTCSPPREPREREGLKRLRSCSEITPVQNPCTSTWLLETRDTILNDTNTSSGATQSNPLPPASRLLVLFSPYHPAQPNAITQPKSILRPPRSSHTDESDDNASDWSDCTSDSGYSDSESTSSTTARAGSPPAAVSSSLPLHPAHPPTRAQKTVHFDPANLLANHAVFRALGSGSSDTIYVTLSRHRRREVMRKALAHTLRAFADLPWDEIIQREWQPEQQQREREPAGVPEYLGGAEVMRAFDERMARQAQEWEERFRGWDARVEEERDREEEKEKEEKKDAGEGAGRDA